MAMSLDELKAAMRETSEWKGGGYYVPHWYAYGGMRSVPKPGLRAAIWRFLGETAIKFNKYFWANWLLPKGHTEEYFSGLVTIAKGLEADD